MLATTKVIWHLEWSVLQLLTTSKRRKFARLNDKGEKLTTSVAFCSLALIFQFIQWAIISGPPKFFVYNFHCKQQNCMKFQLEVYLHAHAAKISHLWVTVLTKTVRDEFNSVTYVVRSMANDAFDQKFRNHNKTQLSKCYDWKVCLALHHLVKAACAQSGRLLPWHMREGDCATAWLQYR